MKAHKDARTYYLTPSACAAFEALATSLHHLEKKFAPKLFTIVWQGIAAQLDDYLFENVVHDNRFNEGGAFQFKFDVTRNLYPLFSQFCEKPEAFFRKYEAIYSSFYRWSAVQVLSRFTSCFCSF